MYIITLIFSPKSVVSLGNLSIIMFLLLKKLLVVQQVKESVKNSNIYFIIYLLEEGKTPL